VRIRKRYFLLIALLGAAVAVVPALASSGTEPTINAIEEMGVYTYVRWSPSEAQVAPTGSVTFQDVAGEGEHGVIWKPGNPEPPTCSGVPNVGAKEWKGTCSFTKPGVYEFECAVHHSLMTGRITVGEGGTTTSSTTSTSTSSSYTYSSTTTTTTTTLPPTTTQTATTAATPSVGGGAPQPPSVTGPSGEGPGSPAPPALLLSRGQHGTAVHGSTDVPPALGGSRLEVDLLATTASLARAHRLAPVRVGRFVRSSVAAGKVTFSVTLSTQAKRALRRHGHLALSVKVTLTPPGGTAVSTSRSVVLRS
jgi:plastocyanin